MDGLILNNLDCHIIVGGDFNVDLSRPWVHTAMLSSFYANIYLKFALRHEKYLTDYSYSFNMSSFKTCLIIS
jgi:polysaccharide pyruvyl transferase WcaK-like protein